MPTASGKRQQGELGNGLDDSPEAIAQAALMDEPPVLDRAQRLLGCEMTETERIGAGQRLALLLQDRRAMEARMKVLAAEAKELLKNVDGEIASVALQVETGIEKRVVDVVQLANFATQTADTVRIDTGELLSSRPLTDHERQQAFNFRDPEPEAQPEAEPEPESGAPA